MKPTKEQLDAMDLANTHCSFKISAYAGAGKTSTLKLIGQTLSDKNGLYLAFNKCLIFILIYKCIAYNRHYVKCTVF